MTTTTTTDSITWARISSCYLPLAHPISDAKVLTGRQKPMTEIAMLFVEIQSASGHQGLGFSYSKRAGGPAQFAHAREIAPAVLGEDPNDIAKLWDKLCWAGASVGRSGVSTQAIGAFDVALWDLKAKRAGLSLAKLLGAQRDSVRCYNTSGGFLHTPLMQDSGHIGAKLHPCPHLTQHSSLLEQADCSTPAAAAQRSCQTANTGACYQDRYHASNWRST
jgi:L-alanine-DL-glutamate epimerase-like enolase superfamily enzyme